MTGTQDSLAVWAVLAVAVSLLLVGYLLYLAANPLTWFLIPLE